MTGLVFNIFWLIILIFSFAGCATKEYDEVVNQPREPVLEPDYSGITIPANIAPMNFMIKEAGSFFKVNITLPDGNKFGISSSDGTIRFPEKLWKKILSGSRGNKMEIQVYSSEKNDNILKKYKPFSVYVANETIDSYLVYRLLHPGYYSWADMKIVQRSLESFTEKPLVDNKLLESSCINCHSFNQNSPEKFMVHVRGSQGGTYFVQDGIITRTDLNTESIPAGATYPTWHPGGRYMTFSSNTVRQSFYAHQDKDIEVYDLSSSLVIYDLIKKELVSVKEFDTTDYLQTFPSWSPDGKYLYYSRTRKPDNDINETNIRSIHYDLARNAFNAETALFSKTEVVVDASAVNESISFPRISPDGKYLIYTRHDYGTFPIWHKEADLWLLNLETGADKLMDINSNEAESYHNWSTNGNWIVFSSKRDDGRSARPYFAYFHSADSIGKPFILPQKNPDLYNKMLETFNLPEFVTGQINFGPRDFEMAAGKTADEISTGAPFIISGQ